jgi:DNA-binding NarL/FixJ family response regulator
LVVDDHPSVLPALVATLEAAGFGTVTSAAGADEALAAAVESRPDVAVIDVGSFPAGLVGRLRAAAPEMRIVVYAAEADAQSARLLLDAGAGGILLKNAPLSDLVLALDAVVAGGAYVDPAVDSGPARNQRLTARELEVLALAAEGLSQEEIGRRLGIGAETVRTHARKAAERLGARSRTQAVATAIRRRLI